MVLGLAGYGLLMLAPMTAGVSALAAVALAYARKPSATPLSATHYRFQTRVFWIGFALCVLAIAAVMFGLGVLYSDAVWALTDNAERVSRYFADPGRAEFRFHPLGVLSLLGGIGVLCAAAAWTLAASTFGLVRLLSQRPIGRAA